MASYYYTTQSYNNYGIRNSCPKYRCGRPAGHPTLLQSERPLKQQLSKIDNSSLNTTHSARNLGFIFDEHLIFSDQISSDQRK